MFRALKLSSQLKAPAYRLISSRIVSKPFLFTYARRTVFTPKINVESIRFATTVATPKKKTKTSSRKKTTAKKTKKKAVAKKAKKARKVVKKPTAKKPKTLHVTKFTAITPKYVFANTILADIKAQKFSYKKDVEEYISKRFNDLPDEEVTEIRKTTKKEKSKLKRKELNEKLPSRPSAFALFVKDHYKEAAVKNTNQVEIFRAVAAEWKALAEDQKAAYTEKANELFQEYKKKKDEVLANQPPKKTNKYNKFVKDNFQEAHVDGVDSKETIVVLSKKWQQLTPEEKDSYGN